MTAKAIGLAVALACLLTAGCARQNTSYWADLSGAVGQQLAQPAAPPLPPKRP